MARPKKTESVEQKEVKTESKAVKKTTPKAEKDAKKAENKLLMEKDGLLIEMGLPETQYRTTGDRSIDAFFATVMGTPGFVKGKVYEFAGKSDVGKTALSGLLLGKFQTQGDRGFFINAEGSLNPEFAKSLGINVGQMIHVRPEHGDAAFVGLRKVLKEMNGQFGVLDSTASMKPRAQVEEDRADMAASARLAASKMPAIEALVARTGATLVLISQIKLNPGVSFGSPEYTSGGSAYGYHSRVRMRFDAVKEEKDEETKQKIGYTLRIKVTKNHTAMKRTTPFDLIVDNAFRPRWTETALAWAKQFKLVNEEKLTVAGMPYQKVGRSKDAGLLEALRGKEYVVFEAVDNLFREAEKGNFVLNFLSLDDSGTDDSARSVESSLAPSADEVVEFQDLEISDEELDDAGSI